MKLQLEKKELEETGKLTQGIFYMLNIQYK